MGCATASVKLISIVFNAILAVLSFGVIGWIAFNPEAQREEVSIAAYFICSLIMLFGSLGIYATARESICLAALCATFLLIMAALQIISTCIGISDHDEQNNGLTIVERAWKQSDMDNVQEKYECCGKTSAQDYVLLNKPIPNSCYENLESKSEFLYINGCIDKVQNYYNDEHNHIIIVSWVLIVFELICVLLALYLIINFRNKQRRMQF